MKKLRLFVILFFLFSNIGNAQNLSSNEIKNARILYKGTWYCKSENVYLAIYFDKEELRYGYVTLNYWQKGADRGNGDSFKGFLKDGKLIMYASNTDLSTSYSEMSINKNRLIWDINDGMDLTSQHLKHTKNSDKLVFYKLSRDYLY